MPVARHQIILYFRAKGGDGQEAKGGEGSSTSLQTRREYWQIMEYLILTCSFSLLLVILL